MINLVWRPWAEDFAHIVDGPSLPKGIQLSSIIRHAPLGSGPKGLTIKAKTREEATQEVIIGH